MSMLDNGGFTSLTGDNTSHSLGQFYTVKVKVKVKVSGSTIASSVASENGVSNLTVSDNTLASGSIGLRSDTQQTSFGTVTVTCE